MHVFYYDTQNFIVAAVQRLQVQRVLQSVSNFIASRFAAIVLVATDTLYIIMQLLKMDVADGSTKCWSETDCSPSEPVFVPSPDAKNEDDGGCIALCTGSINCTQDDYMHA